MVATNTAAQGDTREGGLATIIKNGGQIYNAIARYRWPGEAAVVVSVVHVQKNHDQAILRLNGKIVQRISSFLLQTGGEEAPRRLQGRNDTWSVGTKIYGPGFLFEDGNSRATPIAEMHRITDISPHCKDRISPYIGGEEINSSPDQAHSRYVINVTDVATDGDLAEWPDLERILRERVKPEREALGDNPNNLPLRKRWWAYQGHRPELYAAMKSHERVLANSQVSAHLAFAFQPTARIFANTLNVFLLDRYVHFALLQNTMHDIWARTFGSSMKDDLRYTASDCFETFPFPRGVETDIALESAGKGYYEYRAALMVANNEGLTKTYNRFHDRTETSPEIAKLRELHAQMDRAVLDAYGWTHIQPEYDFRPQLDESERYTWSEDTRDEVLALLLEENQKQAAAEAQQKAAAGGAPAKARGGARGKKANKDQLTIKGAE